jgi:hypothetical protein
VLLFGPPAFGLKQPSNRIVLPSLNSSVQAVAFYACAAPLVLKSFCFPHHLHA